MCKDKQQKKRKFIYIKILLNICPVSLTLTYPYVSVTYLLTSSYLFEFNFIHVAYKDLI